jgi:N-acetylglucosaminyl-diphospho-decaprenol L-rhamnosyltransferase
MTSQISLSVIIVNWNSGELLFDCLKSVEVAKSITLKLDSVVVVDNASTDGSIENLSDIDLPLKIIRNKQNLGFALACNQGAIGNTSDYVLFLNPDTCLMKDSLVRPLVLMELQENRNIGILGIQLKDGDGKISRTCARYPTPRTFFTKIFGLDKLMPKYFRTHIMTEWDHEDSREVDHVMGAFLMIRRQLFEALDGFDHRYFVYLEDLDLSYRAKEAGSKIYYLTEVSAYHKGGGTSENVKSLRMFYSLRSRILYAYKHYGWCIASLLMLTTLTIEPFSRLTLAAWRKSGTEVKETIQGYLLLWCDIPKIFRNILSTRRR